MTSMFSNMWASLPHDWTYSSVSILVHSILSLSKIYTTAIISIDNHSCGLLVLNPSVNGIVKCVLLVLLNVPYP